MALIELPAVVEVYDNDTFDWTLTVTQPAEVEEDPNEVFPLTGVTSACMQWRPEADSPHVALDLSIDNGRFFIPDPDNGVIAFFVTPDALQKIEKRTYATDIVFTIAGVERRVAFAAVNLIAGASRC
jgi:hypothetical protein